MEMKIQKTKSCSIASDVLFSADYNRRIASSVAGLWMEEKAYTIVIIFSFPLNRVTVILH
ncbi:hypothetical protein QQP08_009950 [Theobroma cacao]|nr:hypothetical protein QQP08_009950 [Theobroma cacao]